MQMNSSVTEARQLYAQVSNHVDSRPGTLISLRTKGEIESRDATVNYYFIKVPAKAASTMLSIVKNIPDQARYEINHLRRFVRDHDLPLHLRPPTPPAPSPAESTQSSRRGSGNSATNSSDSTSISTRNSRRNSAAKSRRYSSSSRRRSSSTSLNALARRVEALPMLNVLVCGVSILPLDELKEFLKNHYVLFMPPGSEIPVDIFTATIPLFPPSSTDHAEELSARYWPTIFTNTNPFGPHPSIVAQAQSTIQSSAGKWMSLATSLAQDVGITKSKQPVGCVVVQRLKHDPEEKLVAIATDDRDIGIRVLNTDDDFANAARSGNVAGHAVMRAIALVARKRRDLAGAQKSGQGAHLLDDDFSFQTFFQKPEPRRTGPEVPRTMLEASVLAAPSLEPDGYLCHNLHFYITHEPCTACAMALVHSRIGAVVYERPMPNTGAMSAEARDRNVVSCRTNAADGAISEQSVPGYGLFYREELNWRFMAWEWKSHQPYNDQDRLEITDDVHV